MTLMEAIEKFRERAENSSRYKDVIEHLKQIAEQKANETKNK